MCYSLNLCLDSVLYTAQVVTSEVLHLPGSSQVGHSWYSYACHSPQRLRLSQSRSSEVPQWTMPFDVDSIGTTTLLVAMGSAMARAYVQVSCTGGMQRQVR